jgi:hypothetical protein
LLEVGVTAYSQGDFVRAEALFAEVKNTAQDPADRNQARLCVATVYVTQYVPGCKDAENAEWLEKAEAQFFEVLDHIPFASQEQIHAAISGLGSIAVFRRPLNP